MLTPHLPKKNLYLREWFLLFAILGFLGVVVSISMITELRIAKVIDSTVAEDITDVLVKIEGEVAMPGEYSFPAGICLEKILKKAKPKKFANLSIFDKKEKIFTSKKLFIPKLEKITVFIGGAVKNPGYYEFPVGSKLLDLKEKVDFIEPNDKSRKLFAKNRMLKHGERVIIPGFSE
jgi:hypothetical protein